MVNDKPIMNMPICPICSKEITEISESYSTIGIDYKFNGKKYIITKAPDSESVKFICKHCGKPLPDNFVVDTILKLLPNSIA